MYGRIIREARDRLGWTQSQAAEAIGCSTGYFSHLEQEVKTPSFDLCLAIAGAFGLDDSELQTLLDAVDKTRADQAQARVRTRGRAVRGMLRTGGALDLSEAERIAQDLARDPQLREAYADLKKALGNPAMRATAVSALRAFAKTRGDSDP